MLIAIQQNIKSEVIFQCGCFNGDERELRDYIANGELRFRKTRTLALKTVLTLLRADNKIE
jgi:hypothetical protein